MLEILKFVLSNFWTFCGTVVLIYVSGMALSMIATAACGKCANNSLNCIGGHNEKKGTKHEI